MSFNGLHSFPRAEQPAAPDLPDVPPETKSSRFFTQEFSCSARKDFIKIEVHVEKNS